MNARDRRLRGPGEEPARRPGGADAPESEGAVDPAAGPICDVCGAAMFERHCKILCPVCGYQRDCSDP